MHRHGWRYLGTVRAPGQYARIERCRCGSERRWGVYLEPSTGLCIEWNGTVTR